jgi:transcription initiation factor IIF auxiliary subunit
MRIRLNNYARPLREAGAPEDYRAWRLFVDEPPETLARIASVEYRLHPTFPQPVQIRTDPADNFALESAGWGEFTVVAIVTFADHTHERVSYWLDLSKPWPRDQRVSRRG